MNIDANMVASLVPKVDKDSNKYSRGSVLVIGGSSRYSGAPILAAKAAAKSGAGYTSVMVPKCLEIPARSHLLSIPVICPANTEHGLDAKSVLEEIEKLNHIDCIVLGPGLGVCEASASLCKEIFKLKNICVIADADALNCISGLHNPRDLSVLNTLHERHDNCVLTPHGGELKRLAHAVGLQGDKDNKTLAQELSNKLGCVVVAKGSVTHVAHLDECRTYTQGSASLAKAGTGDVLAGMIGSFIAQGLKCKNACVLGVFAHGLAAKICEKRLGTLSVMPEDVIEAIPNALINICDS